jgi:hypothetical protein
MRAFTSPMIGDIDAVFVCNQTGLPPGVERQTMPRPAPATKGAIVEAFKQSAAYCDRILAAATESWLMDVVHNAEDYGVITTYLRMQGVMPSSSALDTREGR